MSINGNLRTMELAELFQWLAQSGKTGTLLVTKGTVEKRIFFRAGKIISSASSEPHEYLGHFLVSHGFIDEVTLAKAMEMQEQNKMLLGKILVTLGAISEPNLDSMLRLKSEESIYQLFTWGEGDFDFRDGELPSFEMIPLEMHVTGLVLEGVQRLDDWELIRQRISSPQGIPVSLGALDPLDDDPGAKRILSLVDDQRTVEQIALDCHASEYHVCRVLYQQIMKGQIKVIVPQVMKTAEPLPAGDAIDPSRLIESARCHVDQGAYDLAQRHLRAALSLAPDVGRIKQGAKMLEERIGKEIRRSGVVMTAIPRLNRTFEELAEMPISPQEGFILTRINDTYDIQTILKISPMAPIEALVVFWRLMQDGHIEFAEASMEAAS